MTYKYFAYGIPIDSTIELSAFIPQSEVLEIVPIKVSVGVVPEQLKNAPLEIKPFSIFNEHEFLYAMPDIAHYYVYKGEEIIIEPKCDSWEDILLYFYSNCMAAALFQRNLIPFHVSGIFINEHKVLLFAAPSRTGKSTTSVMLQQKGYSPFTDDTTLLRVENGKCFAYASYPMMRLWQNTIDEQTILNESEKHLLRTDAEIDKYGFLFHERFIKDEVQVAGIVFLATEGTQINIEKISPYAAIESLSKNIYRKQWVSGMKKQVLQFKHLTSITNTLPTWKATRPKGQPTFQTFTDAIEKEVINLLK